MSLEQDIHELRQLGLSFSIIGNRLGLSKDQAQKRYQKFLLSNPLPHTPTPEGDGLFRGVTGWQASANIFLPLSNSRSSS